MTRSTVWVRAVAVSIALGLVLILSGSARAQTSPPAPAPSGQTAPVVQQTPPDKPQPEQPAAPRIDLEVTVTAPRMDVPLKDNPAAMTVLPSTLLRVAMPRGIAAEEAMRLAPGVKVDNQADGERVHVSIRGQGILTERGIRGITVLLDGLPLNDPTGFAPDLFDVDWSSVERIEVFRGAASALYGGRSAGGVINITTRDGGPTSASGVADVSAGSYSFVKPFAEVGGTTGSLNYRVSASGNMGDGYRDHTAFHATNLYGKFRWTLGQRTRLTAILAGTHFYNENAEGLNLGWLAQDRRMANPDALTFNEYQQTTRMTGGLSGDTKITPNQDLSFSVYFRHTDWRESVPSTVQTRNYDTPAGQIQYTVRSAGASIRNHLSVGTDLDGQWIADHRHLNLGEAQEGPDVVSQQDIRQRALGAFVLDRIELGTAWGVMLGVRGDAIHNELQDQLKAGGTDLSGDADFSQATGRVGVSWNPRADFGLFAAWGQGFMPPATEELANNPDHLGGFNTHLVPATSVGEEVGVRGVVRDLVTYDATFFHLDTENDFVRYRVPGRPLETFYRNEGASRRYGLETSLGWYPVSGFRANLAYTFSDFRYTEIKSLFGDFSDTVMPNSPRHQLGLDVEYVWRNRWLIGTSMDAQSLQYVDQTNLVWADGFVLLNPRLAFRWTGGSYRGELMLTSRNVLGREFIAFTEPDPDGNSYQPGPTREVFVGLRLWMGK